jgi:hypothetical protein
MRVMRWLLVLSTVAGVLEAQDAAEILRRSVQLDEKDNERLKDYTYLQTAEVKAYRGKKLSASDSGSETSEVLMLAGEQYQRLIEKDGKPLSAKEERKEKDKMDRELARRQHLSASDKAKQEKGRAEGRKFLEQLPDAFTLRIEGVEEISGKPAWVISAERKPGFRPKGSEAKIFTKVRGKVWIDQAEYRWVKAEVEILDTLSMELGLVRVQPGMRVAFEQTRVNDEVWLPSHFSINGDARMGFLIKMHGDMEITYRDYKKFQTDSRIVSEAEAPDGKEK